MSQPLKEPCGENRIGWHHREPTIAEILGDPIVQAVMAADHIDGRLLGKELKSLARTLTHSG
jgi:hypothetical protein